MTDLTDRQLVDAIVRGLDKVARQFDASGEPIEVRQLQRAARPTKAKALVQRLSSKRERD